MEVQNSYGLLRYTLTPLASGTRYNSILKDSEHSLVLSEPDELTDDEYVTSAGVPLSISGYSSLDFFRITLITVTSAKMEQREQTPTATAARPYSFDLLY